jgi:hypothetical protein
MLEELQGAMRRRVALRRAARAGGSGALVLLVAGTVWIGVRTGASGGGGGATGGGGVPAIPVPELARADGAAPEAPTKESALALRIAVVSTDAAQVEKYVARPAVASSVVELSDEELVEQLRRTGDTFGIVRAGDRMNVECYTCSGGGWQPSSPPVPTQDDGSGGRGPRPAPGHDA